jgi:toxin-antitoxin system PIN domain toxin
MIGLDCNILIQLAMADHPAHQKTLEVVQAEIDRGETLVFPPMVGTEFLHVVTDERRFKPPLTMVEATQWLDDFATEPSVNLIGSSPASFTLTTAWIRTHKLGRKRILDTHLAAVLHTNGAKRLLTSNPSDFKVFGVLETVTP